MTKCPKVYFPTVRPGSTPLSPIERAEVVVKGSAEGQSSHALKRVILVKKERRGEWYQQATPVRSNGRSHPIEISFKARSLSMAQEIARQLRSNEATVVLELTSQMKIPKRERPMPHGGGGKLKMLPPGGANGRMEGDYLAVMSAEDGKNNPKWARQHGVFAGSSSWPYEHVPVMKEGEETPPLGKKWVTVSQGGKKSRELHDTYAPIDDTKLVLGHAGFPIHEVAVGGVVQSNCEISITLKIVNNLSSHCKLYETNFIWEAKLFLRNTNTDQQVLVAHFASNPVFYYSNARGLEFESSDIEVSRQRSVSGGTHEALLKQVQMPNQALSVATQLAINNSSPLTPAKSLVTGKRSVDNIADVFTRDRKRAHTDQSRVLSDSMVSNAAGGKLFGVGSSLDILVEACLTESCR